MYIGTVVKAESDPDNNQILVEVKIINDQDEGFEEIRRLAFRGETTKKELSRELRQYMETFNHDAQLALDSQDQEEKVEEMNKAVKDLEGTEI